MARGDHVFVRRGRRYTHHGIDCGDGTVIHFVRARGAVRRVERTSVTDFADGSLVQVRPYRERLPVEEIVANAESRLGWEDYHLVLGRRLEQGQIVKSGNARELLSDPSIQESYLGVKQ